MRYFYFSCIALIIGFSGKLILLEQSRDPDAPIVKEITALPLFWLEQGCDKEWFKHPLVSSLLDVNTNRIACSYSGEIKRSECGSEEKVATYLRSALTFEDGHQECHQKIKMKLLKKIAIAKEAEVSPKHDCEQMWGDASLARITEHPDSCVYSGIIKEEQCAQYPNVQIIHNGSWQCRQRTPGGYWKLIEIKRKTECDAVWFSNTLQTQSIDMDQTKKCHYSGVIDISQCHAHAGAMTIIKPDGSLCILSTAGPHGGGVMQTIKMR